MSWTREYNLEGTNIYIVIINNDETVFAYYTLPDGFHGYVWLYNVVEAPEDFVQTRDDQPPIQPRHLIKKVAFRVPDQEDFEVDLFDKDRDLHAIYIRGQMHALVGYDTKPGWSVLAEEPGQLAKVLEMREGEGNDTGRPRFILRKTRFELE